LAEQLLQQLPWNLEVAFRHLLVKRRRFRPKHDPNALLSVQARHTKKLITFNCCEFWMLRNLATMLKLNRLKNRPLLLVSERFAAVTIATASKDGEQR